MYMEISEPSGDVSTISGNTAPTRRVSIFDQMNINAFWIANNFHWQAILAIILPSMVVKFLGDPNKDINLALVVIWGTLVAIIVNPFIGAVSDYATFRLGRRRPFMIVGTVFNVITLIVFAFLLCWFFSTRLLIIFISLFIFLQFPATISCAP